MTKTDDEAKAYLDDTIRRWRTIRDVAGIPVSTVQQAEYYIDAFQSVRLVLFGAVCPASHD